MLSAHKKAPTHYNRNFFIITRLYVAMEFGYVAQIKVYAANHLALRRVPVPAPQAAQRAMWLLAIQMGPQHPVV